MEEKAEGAVKNNAIKNNAIKNYARIILKFITVIKRGNT